MFDPSRIVRHFTKLSGVEDEGNGRFSFKGTTEGLLEFFPGRPMQIAHQGTLYHLEKVPAVKLPALPSTDNALRIDSFKRRCPESIGAEENMNDGIYSSKPLGEPTHAVIYGDLYIMRAVSRYEWAPPSDRTASLA
jgi:hypothetical protein